MLAQAGIVFLTGFFFFAGFSSLPSEGPASAVFSAALSSAGESEASLLTCLSSFLTALVELDFLGLPLPLFPLMAVGGSPVDSLVSSNLMGPIVFSISMKE